MCVDTTSNFLAYLELIHLYVECLDSLFSNVCELDLVFHFGKANELLDEILMGGEIMETSKKKIVEHVQLSQAQRDADANSLLGKLKLAATVGGVGGGGSGSSRKKKKSKQKGSAV